MLKRISMAGAGVVVTDGRIAELVVEYAMLLGRAGTTDMVAVPVVADGVADEAVLLLGPASQIAVTSNHDASLERVALGTVAEVVADLEARRRALPGGGGGIVLEEHPLQDVFLNIDDYGL